jgi:hypothetical protein
VAYVRDYPLAAGWSFVYVETEHAITPRLRAELIHAALARWAKTHPPPVVRATLPIVVDGYLSGFHWWREPLPSTPGPDAAGLPDQRFEIHRSDQNPSPESN